MFIDPLSGKCAIYPRTFQMFTCTSQTIKTQPAAAQMLDFPGKSEPCVKPVQRWETHWVWQNNSCSQETYKVTFVNLQYVLKMGLNSLCHQKSFILLGKVSPSPDLEVLTVSSLFIPVPARVCNIKNKLLSMEVGMRYLHSWSMQLPAFSSTEVPFILF